MSRLCHLSERKSSSIHLQYHAQTRGVKFDHIIVVGEGGDEDQILRDYAEINGFKLSFVDDPNATETVELLEQIEPDLMTIDTPWTILDPAVFEVPEIATINAHEAQLPAYRGYHSGHWSVLFGDGAGAAAHIVDAGVDTGDVIATRELSVESFETMAEVTEAVYYRCKFQAMIDAVVDLLEGDADRTEQTAENGTQFFEMHDRIVELTERKLQQESG
ncbi:formyltransferase family protein [Haloarcula sp. CGMCC 1.2071]|uniref:formyltransferase family protein n=1 Tax=Haloarcula sp. CGMCC 1.2071 TaxID=3111454 RepID=UPI00300F00D3